MVGMLSVRMTVNKMPGEREVVDKNDFFAGRIVLNKRTYPQKRLPKVFSFPRTVFFFPTVDKFFVSFKNFQHFFKGRLSSNKDMVRLLELLDNPERVGV